MNNEELRPGDRVRIKNLVLRPHWNGCIVTIDDTKNIGYIGSHLVKIKEFENDSVFNDSPDGESTTWVNRDRVEKVDYSLPDEMFEIE